jgi:predicted DNA-binding ribbon-helix-helix protein
MLKKRSLVIAGHATSVTLEEEFWVELKRIAAARGQSLNQLSASIDQDRHGNLSSALRVFVLQEVLAGSARGG